MKKVVFVDDSKTVLMTAEMSVKPLIDEGKIEIKTFENPLDVLELVEGGFVYDLLITDINMPQMNGLELAKKLKSMDSVKLKPILALTTEKSPEMMKKGKELGLAGWIVKPFSPQKLLMGVKRVLRLK
ncbi:MAG: response regulator [Epsilonproteobacteria bacterium]|nr:response regulator [Campylobacterota bacterium]